jgi:hypothetical protein
MVQKESPIPSSSDKSHVIRTSAQWDSSGDQYHVIPRGVLCIELTSNGKTKIKVGEGNKFYSQLPYICDMGDLSNYYTKEEVDLIVENLEFMSIKSTEEYDSRNQLPKIGNKLGDVRFVKNPNNQHDDPLLYVWNGSKWVFSGGSIIDIDLSEYCKKSEILPRLQQLEALSHTHRNKAILDSTSAIYTTEKDEKLASLKNYDVFVPATEEEDGVDGLVPAPSASETDKFLRGDGTWVDVESEKYSAGEGITILSGETIVDGGEAQLFPKTSFLEDYAIYGNEGGVGDYDSALGKYSIPIRTHIDNEESSYETKVLLDNPIESGDYIIYSKQLFVHNRTLMHWTRTYSFAFLDANGVLQTHSGSWVDWTPAVTDFIEIEPGKVYETEKSDYEYYVNQASMFHYRCYHAYYDENQVCTRTVPTSITGRLTFTPVEGEKYLRIAVNRSGTEKRLWLLERTEESVSLDPVRVFPNKTNTINVETTVQPSEIYLKAGVDESEPVDPDDPTSKFTGIIYNDGVLDITQDDPDNLNVLTIHFRDDESKDITINTGVSECVVDIIQADPDNPNALTIKYADGTSTVITIPGGNYHPGDGISFETEQWSVSEQFIGRESEWTNWTFYGPTSAEGTDWDSMVTNAENRSTRCHEIINRTLKIEAWDVNNRALWTVVFLYDQNGTHYTSTNWQKTGTGIVHIIPDSAAYFGIGLARLPDTDTQYSDGRRERMTPSEVKSVKAMWLVEDSGDVNEVYIHNEGVLEVSEKQSAPGVFTVSKRDIDTDIDLFDSLGKITINCNMNPD